MLDRHRDHAIAAVRRIVGDAVDAEDCVHDAMVRLVPRDDLDPARVRALLTRAATHIAIDRLRSERRGQRAMARLGAGEADRVVSPDQVVADREEVGRMMAAVDRLPRREQQVMRMRLAGLSVLETAKLLGLSAKSVEGTYTRARARVRLMVATALAWLAERSRRASSPRGEALAAAVAVLFFAGPLWHNAVDVVPAMARSAGARAVAPPGARAPAAQLAAAPLSRRALGTAPGGGGQATARSQDGGQGHHDHVYFTTGPFYIPNPADPQQPPLFSGGPITIYQTGSHDTVGEIEQCLAQGGPRIALQNGGC